MNQKSSTFPSQDQTAPLLLAEEHQRYLDVPSHLSSHTQSELPNTSTYPLTKADVNLDIESHPIGFDNQNDPLIADQVPGQYHPNSKICYSDLENKIEDIETRIKSEFRCYTLFLYLGIALSGFFIFISFVDHELDSLFISMIILGGFLGAYHEKKRMDSEKQFYAYLFCCVLLTGNFLMSVIILAEMLGDLWKSFQRGDEFTHTWEETLLFILFLFVPLISVILNVKFVRDARTLTNLKRERKQLLIVLEQHGQNTLKPTTTGNSPYSLTEAKNEAEKIETRIRSEFRCYRLVVILGMILSGLFTLFVLLASGSLWLAVLSMIFIGGFFAAYHEKEQMESQKQFYVFLFFCILLVGNILMSVSILVNMIDFVWYSFRREYRVAPTWEEITFLVLLLVVPPVSLISNVILMRDARRLTNLKKEREQLLSVRKKI